jgi:hypothetical protein
VEKASRSYFFSGALAAFASISLGLRKLRGL